MARTPRSAGTQNTLGPVGLAVNPNDIVPLRQAGADTIWGADQGQYGVISVSKQYRWSWNALPVEPGDYWRVPFLMRLKEVDWYNIGTSWDLNIMRGTSVVGTVGANSHTEWNLLFQPKDFGYFITSSFIKQAFNWQLLTRWEIVSRSVDAPVEIESVLSSIPDLEQPQAVTPIPQIEQPLPAAEPIAAKGSNRFSSWIRRRFR